MDIFCIYCENMSIHENIFSITNKELLSMHEEIAIASSFLFSVILS